MYFTCMLSFSIAFTPYKWHGGELNGNRNCLSVLMEFIGGCKRKRREMEM